MAFAQAASSQESADAPKPYRISISKQTMELTLYDANNQVVKCYPMPGTNFKIKLNVML